jgi:hypothetical protein
MQARSQIAPIRHPGTGDTAQFYNLPGRAVFDVLMRRLPSSVS